MQAGLHRVSGRSVRAVFSTGRKPSPPRGVIGAPDQAEAHGEPIPSAATSVAAFTYTAAGNLRTRADARGATATFVRYLLRVY